MSKILIIEDEVAIADLEKDYLELSDFEVVIEHAGDTGLLKALKEDFDLVILDLMLPGMDGFEVCKKIREEKNTPILMVSAKKDDIDKIRGLGLGADDYMTKPFGIMELSARIRSLLRRTPQKEEHPQQLFINGMQIDTGAREVLIDGRNVELTYREFELLMYLYQNNQRVVSRDELLDKLWGYDCDVETRTVDIHIGTLRKKLGDEGSESIKTVRNVGYRLISFDQ